MPPAKATRSSVARITLLSTAATASKQRGIQDFGRICKAVPTKSTLKELPKVSYQSEDTLVTPGPRLETSTLNSRKRNLSTFTEILTTNENTKIRSPAKRFKVEPSGSESSTFSTNPETPPQTCSNQQSLPTPENTPTKDKRCCSNLISSTNESSIRSTISTTPPPSPLPDGNDSSKSADDGLPDEIIELIQLHSCFLRALSLQFTHHGDAAPIDVRYLTPSIAKLWAKRRVDLNDIRRCLAMLRLQLSKDRRHRNHSASIFQLYDYGRGKICIERPLSKHKHSVIARHIDEHALHAFFIRGLRSTWDKWVSCRKDNWGPEDVTAFINDLPLAEVVPCPSLKRIKPLFWEGQQRLENLKGMASAAQTESATRKENVMLKRPAAVKSRSQSLLDRIQAKELVQSSLPPSPTKASLERRAALQRVCEIVSILSLPHTTGRRQTYSLPLLVQTIQNSACSLMSKEEIERCVRLLAEEVARGFVSVVRTADVVGIVVDHKYRPNDLEERIRLASSSSEFHSPARAG